MELMMKDYKVKTIDDGSNEFHVELEGPKNKLQNVFDHFLPQLLTYPNPYDPLNREAAALMMIAYLVLCQCYCHRHAKKPEDVAKEEEKGSSDGELTEDEDDSGDNEIARQADP